jgi:fructosamine-3-kinase
LNSILNPNKQVSEPACLSAEQVFKLPAMGKRISDAHLGQLIDEDVVIRRRTYATGGGINQCEILELDDGRRLFVKTHAEGPFAGMYAAEAKALELLAAPGVLNIPAPLAFDDNYLVLEIFTEGRPADDWQEQMGRGLALLHRATRQDRFGFSSNNFLGTTLQVNTWHSNWLEFFRDLRLGYQLRLLRATTSHEDPLITAGETLLDKLIDVLRFDGEPAVLLHGDLWSGNAAANASGEPVIFDPASYYGNREAEFGMMRLFGGFNKRCEDAYQEVWRLRDGYERRFQVYKLYHQLNHLNLFGRSYYGGCLDTIYSLI